MRPPDPRAPQFLVVGHVVQDLISPDDPRAWRLGGTVSYAAALSRNLGLRTAVLTAAPPDMPLHDLLPGVECRAVPAGTATQIRNVYSDSHRTQYIPRRAPPLTSADLPDDWRETPIVLLGPVAGELDDALAGCFPGALVGVSAQGWLREIGPDASVRPVPPARWDAAAVLAPARALFVSDEDVAPEEAPAALELWCPQVEVLAFTRGERGAQVCHRGEWRHIEAFPASTVDPTGAGDVFAAAFLVRLHEAGDVWEATRYASCAASFVVEGEGTASVPTREQIEARLRAHPEIVCR